jgi:mRNA-degrading endonuclease RelE of RelBE toxin-antitoxin system
VAKYTLLFEPTFVHDLDAIDPYDHGFILTAVHQLADQAEVPTRNRKRLVRPISWVPDAEWELRIRGRWRVFYAVSENEVRVCRVRLKGKRQTEDLG